MPVNSLYALYVAHPHVCTDTRKLTEGCLYFALKGGNFNGNAFAEKAIEQGAAYAIIDEKQYKINDRYIVVDDVLTSLQQLAMHHRRQLNIPVIAIAGSNGKTTTKELISSVLSTKYHLLSTPGNYNNHIGLPLTLLMLTPAHELAVIEMGANHTGENEFLCHIALPSHGLVTNNGKDHLEGFGSMQGVIQSNNELYQYLKDHKGLAFVNAKDASLMNMVTPHDKHAATGKRTPGAAGNLILYAANWGSSIVEAPYKAFASELQPNIVFKIEGYPLVEIRSELSGDYNFDNIMAAVTTGLHFGLDLSQLKAGIEAYHPKNLRSQLIENEHNKIFLDAYNANPSSMEASIRNFAHMPGDNKVLVLGDMFELGKYEAEEHQAIVNYCRQFNLPEIMLVGPAFCRTQTLYRKFESTALLTAALQKEPLINKFIFIKGSRGMQLENLLEWM